MAGQLNDDYVERDSHPIAIIKTPVVKSRKMFEVVAALEASGAEAVIGEDLARDVAEGIRTHREALNPPSWEWCPSPFNGA